MKKVRLDLKRGAKRWSFVLYDSPESAFYLKNDPLDAADCQNASSHAVDYRRIVSLKPGEMMEIEWLGSEWAYEVGLDEAVTSGDLETSSRHEKYDKVRIGKLVPVSDKATLSSDSSIRPVKGYLELYSGWVVCREIPWTSADKRKGLRITPINGEVISKLDFSKIFEKSKPEDDEDESDIPKKMPDYKHIN